MTDEINKYESGQSMVFVALLLTVLFVFVAIIVDIAYMTYQGSRLQNSADSAALAGALLVPKINKGDYYKPYLGYANYEEYVKAQMVEGYVKPNYNEIVDTPIINVDEDNKTVDIKLTLNIPRFLGGLLNDSTKKMTAYAQAEYNSKWYGEALPFLNLSDEYLKSDGTITNEELSIWGKVGPGTFEVIGKDYIDDKFVIEWQNGFTIDNGNVTDSNYLKEMCYKGAILYVFTLKNDVVQEVIDSYDGHFYYYTDNEGNKEVLNGKPVIDKADIILLEVEITGTTYTGIGNNDKIDFIVRDTYDIHNGEIPTNYCSTISEPTSNLIN